MLYLLQTMLNPPTGDAGLHPLVIVLLILCSFIVVGCMIWAVALNRKNSNVETTVITVNEDEEIEESSNDDQNIQEQFLYQKPFVRKYERLFYAKKAELKVLPFEQIKTVYL